jgi:PhnB protein
MSAKLVPYLNFDGNTREAMEFYQSIFGGELKLTTFGEMGGNMPLPDGYGDKIMHAELKSDAIEIMASEGRPNLPTKLGDNVSLSLFGNESDPLQGYFDKLAQGGEVAMPVAIQAWGDSFGMCKDKYGIQWMVNIAKG